MSSRVLRVIRTVVIAVACSGVLFPLPVAAAAHGAAGVGGYALASGPDDINWG